MVEIIWTEPALADLEAIADYIAMQDPVAASTLVKRIYRHVGQLAEHPASGPRPGELGKRNRYRQIIEPPCRVFYRHEGTQVHIVHIMRTERLLRPSALKRLKSED
ncbi:type II toxin-antitoxin system RelE/ParE family toxin [Arenimonas alkanexedens]